MSVHAFIFARGGSKGLPRKNIKLLAGKPLIQYSIETAKNTLGIQHIFVSTEDDEIAQIALQSGAKVIHRPQELATDDCPEWLAWRHAINYVNENYGKFDVFVSLPPTSPLRSIEDVRAAIELFNNKGADICISMTAANRSPFFNRFIANSEGYLDLFNKPQITLNRRQDAPKVFDITTVVYVSSPNFIENKSGLFEGKVVGITVPKERAIDIDDIYDFMYAEVILSQGIFNAGK